MKHVYIYDNQSLIMMRSGGLTEASGPGAVD